MYYYYLLHFITMYIISNIYIYYIITYYSGILNASVSVMSFIGTAPSLITFHQIQNTAAPGCCWHWPPTCGCQEVQDPGCGWCWHFPSGLWDVFQVDHCPTYRTNIASWALVLQWLNWKSGTWWKMLVPRMIFDFIDFHMLIQHALHCCRIHIISPCCCFWSGSWR